MKKTTVFQNGLIWFGAGVSLAEILTGTYFAPLGMGRGLAAILLGHVIGCAMMYLAGLIGGRTGRSAMETVKMSFGQRGGMLFAFLNVLQLVGWTAIMIYDGALAVGGIFTVGHWVWCLVIGGLILLWIAVGITNLGLLNELILSGNLWTYLADLNEQATDRLYLIIRQMAEAEGVTEAMKAENQMLWVQSMNSIRSRAEEIIKAELIYC